jgi:hypothetical protein
MEIPFVLIDDDPAACHGFEWLAGCVWTQERRNARKKKAGSDFLLSFFFLVPKAHRSKVYHFSFEFAQHWR